MARDPYRIAIVGGGPKGFYCLDALCEALRRKPDETVDVTIFEPTGTPGPGNVYDPGQPSFLLMNFASRHIDAWASGPRRAEQLSFCDWAKEHAPWAAAPHAYAPRCDVGRYLADCFGLVRATCPPWLNLRVNADRVSNIDVHGSTWRICGGHGRESYHEVLIATGHQDWQGTEEVRRVFPVSRALDDRAVPAGDMVSLRGFGLTAIDAVLALTLGRGGGFDDTDALPVYRSSGREPARITLLSRSGRPMLAKPEMDRIATLPDFDSRCADLRARIASLSGVTDVARDIVRPICEASDDILACPSGETRRWLATWMCCTPNPSQAQSSLRASWRAATGRAALRPPDLLGILWRAVYPQIVGAVSHGGLQTSAWPRFQNLAREMERIAFGPPAANAARLLALIESDRVALGRLRPGQDVPDIDATLPGPGHHDPTGPLHQLLAGGLVERNAYGTLGVDRDGTALVRGRRVAGLSLIGRMTEVSVLGNDTLSRVLHDTPERWAQGVLSRMEPRTVSAHRAVS